MQQKLCLSLAVVVVLGALVAGNPFLVRRTVAPGSKTGGAKPLGANGARPAPALPVAADARDGTLRTPALRAGGSNFFEATPVLAVSRANKAGSVAGSEAGSAAGSTPADASAELLCPDLELRPHVLTVERDERGEPVWVLRDGTRWTRNKKRGAGQPQLVAADVVAGAK